MCRVAMARKVTPQSIIASNCPPHLKSLIELARFLCHSWATCWHSGALALKTERQSARMSKIKNDGLDQYGAGPFEQQQFGTAGAERVKDQRTLMSPKQKRIWFCRRSSSSARWRMISSRRCWLKTETTSRGNTSCCRTHIYTTANYPTTNRLFTVHWITPHCTGTAGYNEIQSEYMSNSPEKYPFPWIK